MERHGVKVFAKRAVVATMVVATASFSFYPTVRAVSAASVSDNQVSEWTGVKSGDNYVFTFKTSVDPSSLGQREISLSYSDGQQHAPQDRLVITTWGGSYAVKNAWWGDISGASCSASGSALTVTVPTSFFASEDFTASFGGASLSSSEMGAATGGNTGSGAESGGSGSESGGETGTDSGDIGAGPEV